MSVSRNGDLLLRDDRPNANDLAVLKLDGKSQAAKPRWSDDGRELFFMSYASNSLMAVAISATPTFSLGAQGPSSTTSSATSTTFRPALGSLS